MLTRRPERGKRVQHQQRIRPPTPSFLSAVPICWVSTSFVCFLPILCVLSTSHFCIPSSQSHCRHAQKLFIFLSHCFPTEYHCGCRVTLNCWPARASLLTENFINRQIELSRARLLVMGPINCYGPSRISDSREFDLLVDKRFT